MGLCGVHILNYYNSTSFPQGLDQMKKILGGEGFAECNIPDHVIKGQVSKGRPKVSIGVLTVHPITIAVHANMHVL